jgi:hypothetical protein
MNLGITEETLHRHALSFDNLGDYIRETSEDYGRYLSNLYVSLADEISHGNEIGVDYVNQLLALGESFSLVCGREQVDASLIDESLSIPYWDVHSEPFYEQLAKTRGPEQTAAFILVLAALSQINAARILIPKVSEGNNVAGLKARFLYLYHAVHTLNILSNQDQRSQLLYPQALAHIREALGNKSVRKIRKMAELRNNLIHYGIDRHITPRLSEDLPLYRLIEAHTNGRSFANLWDDVSIALDHVAVALHPLLPNDIASRTRVE